MEYSKTMISMIYLIDIIIEETHKIKAEISIIDFLLRLNHPYRSCMFDSRCLPYPLAIILPTICRRVRYFFIQGSIEQVPQGI